MPSGVDHDLGGVGKTVDARDLVAVVRRNRYFDDLLAGSEELQNDLSIEVEVVAVSDKRQIGKRLTR